MDDYISRQDFRKELIDTPFHPRCETTPDLLTSVQDRLNDTLELLDNFPAADVRPVVYCRDCRHSRLLRDGFLYCTTFEAWNIQKDFFCAFGERCGAKMGGTP